VRILITAGPTREPIDPVRFLSNRSTGAMGMALAHEGLRRGHKVTLVLGPVALAPPPGATIVRVETAREMLGAVLQGVDRSDAIICAAAVADYRPAETSATKLKRTGAARTLALVENPDVAAAAGACRGARPFAIFALESEDGVAAARRKLERKNADVCVLNAPEAVGAERAAFTFVFRDGRTMELGTLGKPALALALFDLIAPGR
jgi:phosphopantothenoylcysteine decarboxylase/phosphopantothenate--cysteine ligase